MTPFTETQATYHRGELARQARETAERNGRLLGRLFALELIGFTLLIVLELFAVKINHNVAAALLMGLTDGSLRNAPAITSGNRLHTDRAPPGSPESFERIAAAEAKRARRAAKRCSHSAA